MCNQWVYAQNSLLFVTGNPRYDSIEYKEGTEGTEVYFSPPVIEEIVHNVPSGRISHKSLNILKYLRNIDKDVSLVIQPHYREARVNILREFFPTARFVDASFDPLDVIRYTSKVLVSRDSTTVLDAIALRKKSFIVNVPEVDQCFFKRGYFKKFAIESENRDDLLRNLSKKYCLESEVEYETSAKHYIMLGNASLKISSIINDTYTKTTGLALPKLNV